MYFQVVFSLVKAQDEFKFVHNDLHIENVMFKRIRKGDIWQKQPLDQAEAFRYTMEKSGIGASSEDLFFTLKNMGFLTALSDFGWSAVYLDNNTIVREELFTVGTKDEHLKEYGTKASFSKGYDISFFTIHFVSFIRRLEISHEDRGILTEELRKNLLQLAKAASYDIVHSLSGKTTVLFENFDAVLSKLPTIKDVFEHLSHLKLYLQDNLRPHGVVADLNDPRWILRQGKTVELFRSKSKEQVENLVDMSFI